MKHSALVETLVNSNSSQTFKSATGPLQVTVHP